MVLAIACLLLAQPPFRSLPAKTVVLTYHDVIANRGPEALWFDCTTAELEGQLDWMQKQGAHFITLDELYGRLAQRQPLLSHPVAITFADNYLGFWQRAYPVLKKRRIPCAMFVHTGFVGDVSHGRPKMGWQHLRKLVAEGLVTVASQTVTHAADLRLLSAEQLKTEMTQSKADLEEHLGVPIRYVAYPNGKFDLRSEAAARAAGYWMAFSEETHPAERSSSLFSVNRYVHTKFKRAFADVRR